MTSPEQALAFTAPQEGFLCKLSANKYNIDFLAFKIRDIDSGETYFEVSKPPEENEIPPEVLDQLDDSVRTISYDFPQAFLRAKAVGTALTFKVGKDPVPKFRMIEHHFALGKVMKTVDFTFDFCIPNTTNNWEQIYEMPELSEEEVATITKDKMCADSFYFVNDEMVMHNKAYMSYRE